MDAIYQNKVTIYVLIDLLLTNEKKSKHIHPINQLQTVYIYIYSSSFISSLNLILFFQLKQIGLLFISPSLEKDCM
jgi:hypothetical protein